MTSSNSSPFYNSDQEPVAEGLLFSNRQAKQQPASESNESDQSDREISSEGLPISDQEAVPKIQSAFTDLEAEGLTHFQIFNALSDLFHRRRRPELSRLMADAAYQCYRHESSDPLV